MTQTIKVVSLVQKEGRWIETDRLTDEEKAQLSAWIRTEYIQEALLGQYTIIQNSD